jgi:hypothetical protein
MDDTSLCPLCGETNECGAAEGRSQCWCCTTAIPAAVLAQIPEADRNRRCVCQRCASSVPATPAPALD